MDAAALESRSTAPTPPPSLLAWIPYLWQHVVFPARPQASSALSPGALALVLLLPALLLYPSLSFDLFEPDETRYAQIPREMLERGEWIVPTLQGEPYLDKPPLFYWLVMVCYQVAGVSAASARLVPALALHLTIILLYLQGRRWVGSRAACWGAVILTLSPAFLGIGRLLLLDGLLCWWLTLSLFAAFEAWRGDRLRWSWWCCSAIACGLAVLTKGPVGLLLILPPLLLHQWLTGAVARLTVRAGLVFLAIVLLLAVPWYVAVCCKIPAFARYFLWDHNVMRFVAPFDHQRGVFFYLPIVLGGLLPTTLLLWPLTRFLLSGEGRMAAQRCADLGFLLLAGGWCLFFFTLSGCKLPTYILPAFPPLALALGVFLTRSAWEQRRATWVTTLLAFAILCLGHNGVLPWYAHYRSPVNQADKLARYCADPDASVVCYPRPCNAVAFHFGRDDLPHFRSKDIEELRTLVRIQPRTVILCTHRHSLEGLRQLLPPEVRIVETAAFDLKPIPGVPASVMPKVAKLLGETALGLCDLAVVEYPGWKPRDDAPPVRLSRDFSFDAGE